MSCIQERHLAKDFMAGDDPNDASLVVQALLDRLKSGDESAIRDLFEVSVGRLRSLSRKIMADIPAVKRWEDTDDLLQNSSLRLWKALCKHKPETPIDYFRLAAALIRRELIDLSRHYFGPAGLGANHARSDLQWSTGFSSPTENPPNDTYNPEELAKWSEFHAYVEQLPDDERSLFDLLWYQGMTLHESAELLGRSERTVRRQWKATRLKLYSELLEDPDH